MLQTQLPAAPIRAGPPSQTVETDLPPARPTAPDPSHRFYRSMDSVSRADSPNPTEPVSTNEDESQASIEDTRRGALHTLSLCQSVITTLELTRLRKSRTGVFYWLAFWERLYPRAFARSLGSRVNAALTKVDILFRTVANELHQLTLRMEYAIARSRRATQTQTQEGASILNKMRVHIEGIPVKVSDELFDDMKRGVFALDVFCDYHPGDPVAEEHETMWPEYFVQQSGMGMVAVSPYLYRQWQQEAASAASGSYMPLSSYTGNNAEVEYLEEEYHGADNWRPDGSRSARRW
ncbi:hypothetical protein ANOM_009087 [Aspergillus nomiae NRRL 13137]|uniref:Uncharacterized protein n=1 Tax=Aspergillus nomiae NRRL (strain ATCC 15546 / NRRL 13137 / CBS 260.88 / M93) TaxID=1509407 RepID=A0A0L1IT07_ASPN3|nr:uncharacterized protein ANOM_009087 [Aspergillus nomiae NRRL 13137]KNG82627.1 hypothetical protein ANOM_009087 [Aspergillus nomiae NRRL 13137]